MTKSTEIEPGKAGEASIEAQSRPKFKADIEKHAEPACIDPGVCLCEIREQMGLNRAKVGQQLGLTETAVKDLEKNRFERFPGSVYVRGYLKNYAKILGESESEIIGIYDRFCKANNLDSGKSTLESLPEKKQLSVAGKVFIGIAIVGVLAALSVFFWRCLRLFSLI